MPPDFEIQYKSLEFWEKVAIRNNNEKQSGSNEKYNAKQ